MVLLAAIDWTTVLVAGLTGVPATIASVLAYMNHRNMRTPSGESIGSQVEKSHHVGIANNMLLREQSGLGKLGDEEKRAE